MRICRWASTVRSSIHFATIGSAHATRKVAAAHAHRRT